MLGKKKQVARNALGAALILAFTATPAAFAADEMGWYLGAGYGQSKSGIADEAKINSFLIDGGYDSASTTADKKGTGLKLFGGYQFTSNWAVELAYVDLGKLSANAKGTSGVDTDAYRFDRKAKGWSIAGVGTAMVSDTFGVFGKLGAFRSKLNATCSVVTNVTGFADCGESANLSASRTDLTYGLGLRYNLTKQTSLRVEWERFKGIGNAPLGSSDTATGKADFDLISIGIQYKL